jgi:threonine/homoserine/homoserine lactone efflux protein
MDLTAAGGLAGFVVAAVLAEITPGPNMSYLAIVALGDGRRAGLAAVAGVALGLSLLGIAAALGLGALVATVPGLAQILRWGGAAYLLWLAWQGWKGADEAPEHAPRGSTLARFFRRGLLTNLLNPKAFAFYLTVLPAFVPDAAGDPVRFLTMAAIYVAIATGIHASIVLAAASRPRTRCQEAAQGRLRRLLSVLLALVAVWLVMATAG